MILGPAIRPAASGFLSYDAHGVVDQRIVLHG